MSWEIIAASVAIIGLLGGAIWWGALLTFRVNYMWERFDILWEAFLMNGSATARRRFKSSEISLPPEIREKAEALISQVKIKKPKEPYTNGDLAFLLIKQIGMEKVASFAAETDLLINESLAILVDIFKERMKRTP